MIPQGNQGETLAICLIGPRSGCVGCRPFKRKPALDLPLQQSLSYCYLPLYIFAGDQQLCARLRPANIDGAAGALDEVKRIVAQLRAKWPKVRIVLRGDSGFCREQLMAWCEAAENHVDFLFGLARNRRLQKIIGKQMHEAKLLHAETGKAARVFTEFNYQTRDSWARARRVVAKPSIWTRAKTRDSSLLRSAPIRGRRANCTSSSTASAARWRTASRSRCACSPIGSRPKR